MSDAQVELARRYLLIILDAARMRERGRAEDPSTYTGEELMQLQLSKMGLPMLLSELRAHLLYLRDKGLAKFHETRIGRDRYWSWRITAEGVDVLDGTRTVPGIARA